MGGDVDGEPLIGPTGEHRDQHQMARRAHREKLGNPLHQGNDEEMEKGHVNDVRILKLKDGGRIYRGRWIDTSRGFPRGAQRVVSRPAKIL